MKIQLDTPLMPAGGIQDAEELGARLKQCALLCFAAVKSSHLCFGTRSPGLAASILLFLNILPLIAECTFIVLDPAFPDTADTGHHGGGMQAAT